MALWQLMLIGTIWPGHVVTCRASSSRGLAGGGEPSVGRLQEVKLHVDRWRA